MFEGMWGEVLALTPSGSRSVTVSFPSPKVFRNMGCVGESFVVTMNGLSQVVYKFGGSWNFVPGARDAKCPVIHRTLPAEEEVSL